MVASDQRTFMIMVLTLATVTVALTDGHLAVQEADVAPQNVGSSAPK
jgi:hypothetical protein